MGLELAWSLPMEAYLVSHVVRGDVWDETASGPMARLGSHVKKGDFLTAVNRRRLTPEYPVDKALQDMAGKEVPTTHMRRTFTM